MRRPLLLIFIIILILGFFITLGKELDNINSDIDITISGVVKDKKFYSFEVFGKWVADNATEISIIDVIQEEE